jgi:hypothetical protein
VSPGVSPTGVSGSGSQVVFHQMRKTKKREKKTQHSFSVTIFTLGFRLFFYPAEKTREKKNDFCPETAREIQGRNINENVSRNR